MKYVIGCLALIGLSIILVIGGCLGLIGVGFAALPKTPSYVTRDYIEKTYAGDLKAIDHALSGGTIAALANQVSDDVIAIFDHGSDVLKKHMVRSKSFHEVNGIGYGSIDTNTRTVTCIVYEMSNGAARYDVFLADRAASPPAAPSGK
jgi:hypothetical protein